MAKLRNYNNRRPKLRKKLGSKAEPKPRPARKLGGKDPPYDLDPMDAVKNSEALPLIVRRGIGSVLLRPNATEGSVTRKFTQAFNYVVAGLVKSKRLFQPTKERPELRLTRLGREQQQEMVKDRKETYYKIRAFNKFVERVKRAEGIESES